LWWDGLNKRLDQLGKRISQEDRRRIEAAIAKKVPRPTKKQYDQCVRDVRNTALRDSDPAW
jgi:predicted transcriptional regulator